MGLIQKIALSKWGQKIYKHAADPKNEKFYNNTLPTLESVVAGAMYVIATARQKDIDPDRRALLQWQNISSSIVGIGIGSWLNRKVSNYADKIIPLIDKTKINDVHKVVAGLKIFLPCFATAFTMRMAVPSVLAWFSGKAEEVRRAKRDNKNKLNVVA